MLHFLLVFKNGMNLVKEVICQYNHIKEIYSELQITLLVYKYCSNR